MVSRLFRKKKTPLIQFDEVNRELKKIGSKLQIVDRVVSNKNRMSRVYNNYIDFWENGIKWHGVQGIKDPMEMALLIVLWNERCLCSSRMESHFPALNFPVARKKIEESEDAYLDWCWEKLKNQRDKRFAELIELSSSHPLTRRLMTYVQLRDFGFSRSIGTVNGVELSDLPRVRITDEWEYEVRTPNQAMDEYSGREPRGFLGKGNAGEAFRVLLNNLPPNCGPATYQRGHGCCPPAA